MRYKLVKKKPYCCVPASLVMVLNRRGIKSPPQEDIAYELGIVLPPNDKDALPRSHDDKPSDAGWGTRIHMKEYSLTNFFNNHDYPLKEEFVSAKKFSSSNDMVKLIKNKLNKNFDILTCFDASKALNFEDEKVRGHCCVINNISKEKISLVDPRLESGTRDVPIKTFYRAVRNHFKGGFWLISEK